MAELKSESWRVFCAIELPSLIRERIAEYSSQLRERLPGTRASWSRPENIHLTLKFVSSISPTRVAALTQAAARSVEQFSPFDVHIVGTGAFPPRGSPRVLWIGTDDRSGELALLQRRLDDECLQVGFEKEARAFNPHLTIARLRRPEGAQELAQVHRDNSFMPIAMTVSELAVIRSELSNSGSRYTVISKYKLSGTDFR